jgi:hypothetical protein
MSQIVQFIGGLGLSLLLILPFLAPMFILGWILHRRKRQFRATAHDPFTEMPLRPPGESTRLKLEELAEQYDDHILFILLMSVVTLALTLATPAGQQLFVGSVMFVLAAGVVAFRARSIFSLQQKLWDYRLGFTGERAVGEALNQLFADGFQIFHDLPFEGFNIDHVIVGPPGVYAVETKTRRKPAHLRGTAKATVIFDGQALHYPWGQDTHGLTQAARNAATLAKWLAKSTGEPTPVNAILALPGWWVERKATGPVAVLNPKEIRRLFPQPIARPLSPDRIQRIAFQLTERCRLEKPE